MKKNSQHRKEPAPQRRKWQVTVAWRPQTEEEQRQFNTAARNLLAVWIENSVRRGNAGADTNSKRGEHA